MGLVSRVRPCPLASPKTRPFRVYPLCAVLVYAEAHHRTLIARSAADSAAQASSSAP